MLYRRFLHPPHLHYESTSLKKTLNTSWVAAYSDPYIIRNVIVQIFAEITRPESKSQDLKNGVQCHELFICLFSQGFVEMPKI